MTVRRGHREGVDNNTLDGLMEGCQLIGYDWRYLYVNDAVVKQSRFDSKEDLLGYTMMEKYPGIEHSEMFLRLQKCMEERLIQQMINQFTFPDGSWGWFDLRMQPVPDGVFILSVDITEQVRVQEALEKHVKSLEEIIQMTSHQVRKPLANLMGMAQLSSMAVLNQDEVNKLFGYMRKSVQSLDVYLRELTDFIIHSRRDGDRGTVGLKK